jgi:hypothetical protein
MPSAADGRESVVVFLEGAMDQHDLARRCALRMPGVLEVSFSGHTRAIMYLHGADSVARAAAALRNVHGYSPHLKRSS